MTAPSVDLSALDALAEAAGLERWERHADTIFTSCADGVGDEVAHIFGQNFRARGALIVALRNAWPALKAEIEALRGENEKMRGALREVRGDLLAGFIVCEHCGHQDTTSDMDVMLTLNAALGATS